VSGFVAVFRAEARDLARHPLVWAGTLAVAAAAWLLGRHALFHDNGYTVYESALGAAGKMAGFFLLGIAAVTVAGDRSRGTVRFILPRPIARGGFVLGKGAALMLLALFFLLVGAGTSLLTARAHGFGDVLAVEQTTDGEDGFEFVEEPTVEPAFAAGRMQRRMLLATLAILPALWCATGLGLLVSSLFGSAAGAVIVSIGLALPLNYLPEVVGLSPEAARALPFRAASDCLDQLQQFGRHLATAEWPAYGWTGALGAVVAGVGLPLLAAAAFARLDITD